MTDIVAEAGVYEGCVYGRLTMPLLKPPSNRVALVFDYSDSLRNHTANIRPAVKAALERLVAVADEDTRFTCYILGAEMPIQTVAAATLRTDFDCFLDDLDVAAESCQAAAHGSFLMPSIADICHWKDELEGPVKVFVLTDGELFDDLIDDDVPNASNLDLIGVDIGASPTRNRLRSHPLQFRQFVRPEGLSLSRGALSGPASDDSLTLQARWQGLRPIHSVMFPSGPSAPIPLYLLTDLESRQDIPSAILEGQQWTLVFQAIETAKDWQWSLEMGRRGRGRNVALRVIRAVDPESLARGVRERISGLAAQLLAPDSSSRSALRGIVSLAEAQDSSAAHVLTRLEEIADGCDGVLKALLVAALAGPRHQVGGMVDRLRQRLALDYPVARSFRVTPQTMLDFGVVSVESRSSVRSFSIESKSSGMGVIHCSSSWIEFSPARFYRGQTEVFVRLVPGAIQSAGVHTASLMVRLSEEFEVVSITAVMR